MSLPKKIYTLLKRMSPRERTVAAFAGGNYNLILPQDALVDTLSLSSPLSATDVSV